MAASLAPLDNDCNLHLGMLRTVYRFLILQIDDSIISNCYTQAADWVTSRSSAIWRSLGGDRISRH